MIVVIPLSFLQTNKPLGELIGEISRTTYETPLISRTEYLLTQMRVIVSYVRLLILPIKQSVDYIFPLSKSFFEAYTFLSFCFIMLIIFLAIILYKKYPLITFGIVWFLIFLAVESSVIPIIDVIFEHRVYLPSVGFIVAVVYAIYIIDEKLKKKWVIPAIFSIIIIALCIATWHRNMLWGNPVALWKDTVEHFPNNPRALGNLGLAFASEKRYSEAVQVLRKAVEVNPRIGNNWYALAVCYKELQLIDDAIKSYRTTLELNPKFQKAAYDLADIYMQQKRYDDAYKLLMDAKKIDEKHPYTNSLLAQYYCEIGEIGVAKLLMSEAEKNGLDLANSFFNIGICMLNHNELFYAQRYFFRTIEFNKDEVESYFFIGVTYDRMNDIDKAVYFYKQYLQQAKLDAEWRQRALMRLQELGR
jgi:tetratricopeptide (TPR) repeat protein